jgi:putative transcriptional regulator
MEYFDSFVPEQPEKGDLLISEPFLPDPNFERSVILLCEHDENGTFGYVLNQLSTLKFDEVIEESGGFTDELLVGGPVQQDTLHLIHRRPELIEDSKSVNDEIYWGGDFDRIVFLLNTKQIPKGDVKFFIGYSGWSPGQLMNEIEAKSWIVYKNPTAQQVFDSDANVLWRKVLNEMGGKFKTFSNYPSDPRMN